MVCFLGISVSLRGVTWLVSSMALAERARVGSSSAVVDCLFTISVFTHIVPISLRTVALGQGVQWFFAATSFDLELLSRSSVWFASDRHFHCLFWALLHSFRELSLSQRLSVLWLRLVFVHEFGCELILCRVPLIWERRCHSSLLIDLVHL